MAIMITLIRERRVAPDGKALKGGTIVKSFADDHAAAKWFVEESCFEQDYTVYAKWERWADEEY